MTAASISEQTYGIGDALYSGLAATLAGRRPYLKLQRRTGRIDHNELRKHLEIGWTGELQLNIPAWVGQGHLLRYTNAWAPIHAYFASYMLLQGWFDANAMTGLADDHAATLKTIASQIRDRDLFPPPWSVLCAGNAIAGNCTYIHEPQAGACDASIQVLSLPLGYAAYSEREFWARIGTWLRTTREARLKLREGEWKRKQGRQRIAPAVRVEFADKLHPTSLFECLWRLRIRSNYRSVESYLVSFVSDSDHEAFHDALATITRANMFLLECYIARVVGAAAYRDIADAYLARDQHGLAAQTVGTRLDRVLATAATPGAGQRP